MFNLSTIQVFHALFNFAVWFGVGFFTVQLFSSVQELVISKDLKEVRTQRVFVRKLIYLLGPGVLESINAELRVATEGLGERDLQAPNSSNLKLQKSLLKLEKTHLTDILLKTCVPEDSKKPWELENVF